MTTNEISIVTKEELQRLAYASARKLSALELAGRGADEFIAGLTCLEEASLGWMGAFTPQALNERGLKIEDVSYADFDGLTSFVVETQNKLIAAGIDVRRFLARNLSPEMAQSIGYPAPAPTAPEEWTYGDRVISRDLKEAFPTLDWEFERASAGCLLARSGPLRLDFDDSLPEMIGVELEFPRIPRFDFRASSVALVREVLMEVRDELTGLLGDGEAK